MMIRAEKKLVIAAALAVLTGVPAAARPAAAAPDQTSPSCGDAQALEMPYELSLSFSDGRSPETVRFSYAGCREEGRNDYLPAYTERTYKGADGYGLVLVTSDGETASEVLISRGDKWVGDFRGQDNAALTSGDVIPMGAVDFRGSKAAASLRGAASPLYPQLKTCEAALASASPEPLRVDGAPLRGFSPNGPYGTMSLVLLTKTDAFYYHQDCDICAAIDKCSLASGQVSHVLSAHSADCSDLAPYSAGAVYTACP